jgi:hypothetical protein
LDAADADGSKGRRRVLDQLAHRLGDGFDVFEVENFLVDALDLGRAEVR